jgi:hypothetical protein
MAKTNAEIAIELRAKFEAYMLALTFTVLALSIQTAKFGTSTVADTLELGGWLTLFIAGVTALLRGEWIPVLYDIQSKIDSTEKRIQEIEAAAVAGINLPVVFIENSIEQQVPPAQAIQKLRNAIAELEKQYRAGEKRIRRRYTVAKVALIGGIGFIIIARAHPNIKPIVDAIGCQS